MKHCLFFQFFLINFLFLGNTVWADLLQSSITVTNLQGQAVLINSKTQTVRRLSIGDTLNSSDVIVTDNESEATLYFSNGSTVKLSSNTHLSINLYIAEVSKQNSTSQTELSLNRGSVVGDVVALTPGSNYNVYSPAGSAAIRGTTYLFDSGSKSSIAFGKTELNKSQIINKALGESSNENWKPTTPPTFAIQKGSGVFKLPGETTFKNVPAGKMMVVTVSPSGIAIAAKLAPLSPQIANRFSNAVNVSPKSESSSSLTSTEKVQDAGQKKSLDLGSNFFKTKQPNAVKKINAPSDSDASKLVNVHQDFSNLSGRYVLVRFVPEKGSTGIFSVATFYATRNFSDINRASINQSLTLRSQNLLTQTLDNSKSIRGFLEEDFQVRLNATPPAKLNRIIIPVTPPQPVVSE
jgi:hypothetical protein